MAAVGQQYYKVLLLSEGHLYSYWALDVNEVTGQLALSRDDGGKKKGRVRPN
jgi:hypothetical protein